MTIEDCHSEVMDKLEEIENLKADILNLYNKANKMLEDMDQDDEEYENCAKMVDEIWDEI